MSARSSSGIIRPCGSAILSVRIVSTSLRYSRPEPDLEGEPPLALDDLADDLAAQGRDHVEHVGGVDPVAGDPVAVDVDPQERQAAERLGLHVGRPRGSTARTAGDRVGLLLEDVQVVAVEADARRRPGRRRACSLNRSSIGWLKLKNVPGMTSRGRPRRSGRSARPWSWALVQRSGSFRKTQTSVMFTPAGSRPISGRPIRLTTVRISSGNASQQGLLQPGRVGDRLVERGARAGGSWSMIEVPLVELGDELAAQPQRHRHARGEAPATAAERDRHRAAQRPPRGPARRPAWPRGSARCRAPTSPA